MTSPSEPVSHNESTDNRRRESNIKPSNTNPNMPPRPSTSEPPPPKTHCEVTCKKEKDWWDKAKPFVELAGIAILAVYTLYTVKIYRATQQAAEAANKSIFYNRAAAMISTQASLFFRSKFESITAGTSIETGKKAWLFNFALENGGNTPAFNVRQRINDNVNTGFAELPKDFMYPDIPIRATGLFPNTPPETEGTFVIGAHSTIGAGGLAIENEVLQRVNNGNAHVYFWGRVTYNDIFGCQHETKFCRQIVAATPDGKVAVQTCPKNNCADQDCKDYQPTDNELCSALLIK